MTMRYSLLVLTIPIYIIISCINNDNNEVNSKQHIVQKSEEKGFAVLELFTSQGCSSCPPADRILTDWVDKAEKEGIAVYPLAFHVDYWNKLGWKDPYSQAQFTERQSAYAEKLRLTSIYTPQLVINGQEECVGSNTSKINAYVREFLSKTPEIEIALGVPSTTDGKVDKVAYNINGDFKNCVLNIALVEKGLVTQVKRGENSGRKLINDNVVRDFSQITPQKSGSIKLDLNNIEDKSKTSLIVFLQDKTSLKILAARAVKI